jgi:hypothetical protein
MALTEGGLFHIEKTVRMRADRIRSEATTFDDASAESQLHARSLRTEADELDMAADLLVGLQADWARLGPMVRDGFKRLRIEHERIKALAAAPKASEAA